MSLLTISHAAGSTQQQFTLVELALEDAQQYSFPTVNGAVIKSILEIADGALVKQLTPEEASDDLPVKRTQKRNRRSLIWRHYDEMDSSSSVRCRICSKMQSFEGGSTSNLHRHISTRHPEVSSQLLADRQHLQSSPASEDTSTQPKTAVDLDLAADESEKLDEAGVNSPCDIYLDQDGCIVGDIIPVKIGVKRSKRSLIWKYYDETDSSSSARCCICRKLQSFEGGSTGNLHRHISKRHPEVYSQLLADRQQSSPASEGTSTQPKTAGVTEKRRKLFVDSDLDLATDESDKLEEAGINSPCEIYLDEDGVGHIVSDDRPVQVTRNKRSLIWRHFEHLDSLNAARCHICMKKIQCSDGRSTSNLHRHLSKRHPAVFTQLLEDGKQKSRPNSSRGSNVTRATSTLSATHCSGALEDSRASEGEKQMFKREQELIEALRRAQRQEARALEDQRELLEMLRVGNAREAAAEREEIESLRKAQLEEAKYLSKQREELKSEKQELQIQREELQQEREKLVLLSNKPDPATI
ncbi:uncharacterized protein LOC117533254 isoform X1 [Gymnodraco acuticeps]|uniref:Uncharacterized protein LOC117533254 isoform X1 n=1 Tax=Gymnodraco acuticeps TaxID=8218 RepID=A0A6P8SPX3_GYMAC|nr:uncharacterized protein LOC117533254 isoform X1 [Gymnodraco acuticeps]